MAASSHASKLSDGELDSKTWPQTSGPYETSARLLPFVTKTVWEEFTPLAKSTGAVNLGQGFPDWAAPDFVKEAMVNAVTIRNDNQYTRSAGHPSLVQKLARLYSGWLGRAVDWESEVTVTVGATEALFALTQSLLGAEDEAVILEPSFDIYAAQITMAGAASVRVPLRLVEGAGPGGAAGWKLDPAELEAALTPKSRLLILNTPHNPTGKVFTREELESIARIVRAHPRLVVLCDEVYEHLTYDGAEHVRLASLPGMWDRCVTVSSSGKTFSVTGWKVGWVVGPRPLVRSVMTANAWVQFSVPTPTQSAIAEALAKADSPYQGFPSFYHFLRAQYRGKRDRLVRALRRAGMRPIVPSAGFFIMAQTAGSTVPDKYMAQSTPSCPKMTRDWALARHLTIDHGVACIPPSAFYCAETKPLASSLLRFAFCKTDSELAKAAVRLAAIGGAEAVSEAEAEAAALVAEGAAGAVASTGAALADASFGAVHLAAALGVGVAAGAMLALSLARRT
ncbi:hypothetical protein FNF27_05772 [Cafeteria roenbergensis]|uniref:Aminotransferase class I/classII large domain-containing protein n=2 Tax=Cafeteria roenbergensis TaxID=33653 RepID=A0A5A8E4T8_CAFRO|nr:hypothetical protein FNF27_05772 [Cafeteria roenbergensis]